MRIIVTVPCYNEEEKLDVFLDRIAKQTLKVDLIAIDDGSSDGTFKKLREANVLHVAKNEPNQGLCATYNRLMRIAESYSPDYLAWSGADDFLYPDSIERRLDHLVKTDSDIVITGSDTQTREGLLLYPTIPHHHLGLREADFSQLHSHLLAGNFLQVPILANMRRVSFRELYYNTSLKHFADWEQQLRLSKLYKYAFLDQSTGCSDWDGTNMSSPDPFKYPEKIRELCMVLGNQARLLAADQSTFKKMKLFAELLKNSISRTLLINRLASSNLKTEAREPALKAR